MASANYQYEPLTSESSFRVLRLSPLQPGFEEDATIEIVLSEADFDRPPHYEAISYAWGNEEANTTIICNGNCLLVTPNVVSVLQTLRRSNCSQALWIDSIAIDQSSIIEKNIQVPRMRSIYRQATNVWVWLGEGGYEVDIAFQYLLDMDDLRHRKFKSVKARNDFTIKTMELFHSEQKQVAWALPWNTDCW